MKDGNIQIRHRADNDSDKGRKHHLFQSYSKGDKKQMKESIYPIVFILLFFTFFFLAGFRTGQITTEEDIEIVQVEHEKKIATKQLALDISISRNAECRDIVNGIIEQFDYIEPRPITTDME